MAYVAKIDTDEVRAALHLLVEDTFEIRVFGLQSPRDSSAYGTYSAYFDDSQIDKAASMVGRLTYKKGAKSAGVYLTLNPVHPGLKFKAHAEWMNCGATKDADVLRRRWFPVDVDPLRSVDGLEIKGIPASEEERSAAASVSESVWRYLIDEQGWPSCVLADSGNGSHALWRIDQPNDEATRDLIKSALAYLAQRFGTDAVDIDTTVYNAARIWKLYGTTGAKGSSTPERPHRRGKVLQDPLHTEIVTREQLEALAALYVPEVAKKAAKKRAPAKKSTPGARPDPIKGEFDLEAWLDHHQLELSKVSARGKGVLYELAECPWHGLEHARKAWVHHRRDGVISHGCQGGRCRQTRPELTWAQMRAHYEPEYAERQRPHLHVVRDDEPQQEPPKSSTDTLNTIDAIKRKLLFAKDSDDFPDDSITNLLTVLQEDPRWKKTLAFDLLRVDIITVRRPPWGKLERSGDDWYEGEPWTDNDDTALISWLRREYDIRASAGGLKRAVNKAAATNCVHRFREYLHSLEWDGVPRLDEWLIKGCGVEDSQYTRMVGARWIISVTARAHPPLNKLEGVKVDNVLILEGRQGLGKSRAFAALVPREEWVSDSHLPIGHKDAFQSLAGKVIYELAEIDGYTSKREDAIMKAFLSSAIDNYRPPYQTRNINARRPCVFGGTANKEEYLLDVTGNRRYWPVKATLIDLAWIKANRDQMWAEADARRRKGELWWIDNDAERALAEREQLKRVIGDAWGEIIAEKLALWLAGWRDIDEANLWTFIRQRAPTYKDVFAIFIGIPPERMKRSDNERAALAMVRLGFVRRLIKRPPDALQLDERGRQTLRDGGPVRRTDAGKAIRAFIPAGTTYDARCDVLDRLTPILAPLSIDPDCPF